MKKQTYSSFIFSKYFLFIIKLSYVLSIGILGIQRITNSAWNTGIWWDSHLVTNGDYSAIAYIFSLSVIKWNLILLIPLLEVSAFLLLRTHTYTKQHLYLLFFYHLLVFFILTHINARYNLYWTPFLQFICLLFIISHNTVFNIQKKHSNHLKSTSSSIHRLYKPQILIPSLFIFVLVQCSLPFWPYLFIHEDINWTLKGTHFSWRMKINSTQHEVSLLVLNKKTSEKIIYTINHINFRPGVIKYSPYALIYYAHALKKSYAKDGLDVAIYANAFYSLNSRPFYRYIDPTIDLSITSYHFIKSNSFVIPIPSQ